MTKMLTDQQYQQLLARSGVGSISSQLLLAQSQSRRGDQYLSRTLYPDRAVADPYYAAGSTIPASKVTYPAKVAVPRSDTYLPSDPLDIRAQLTADRRTLLPSPTLPSSAYVDRVGQRAISGLPVSPEVVAYPGRYPSAHGPQALSSAASQSELLARARRAGIASAYAGGAVGTGSYVNSGGRLNSSAYNDVDSIPDRQASILSSGGRRGRDLDRYLLAVQPEKLIQYTAACLAPDPLVKRTRFSNVGADVYPEGDPYSNYRRAKARRIERDTELVREREAYEDRDSYRDRRRRRERSRDRGKYSPSRRSKPRNGSESKGDDADRRNRPYNSQQTFEGREQRSSGGQDRRSRHSDSSGRDRPEHQQPSEPNVKAETEATQKKGNAQELDKEDSELGSLCAGLSDSEDEKEKKLSEEPATVIDEPLAGMIFGCSSATFHECMKLQLFGLPAKNKEEVLRVTPGIKVFLFNFDTKELSGIFEAVSHGGWQIDPEAFRDFGGFPSQVQVRCSEQCPNLTLSTFKPAIQDNYVNQHKFKFDLNSKQVKDLVRLFRKEARSRPLLRGYLSKSYLGGLPQSQDYPTGLDYPMRGMLQRPFTQRAIRWPN